MTISFDFFDLVVILGITQGLLYAGLVLAKYGQYVSKRLLALVLIVFCILSSKILLHALGLWQNPTLRYFPLAFDLTLQPLLYLYVISLTQKQFQLRQSHLIHFVPTLVFLLHAVIVYSQTQITDNLALKDQIAEQFHFNAVKKVEDLLSVLSGVFYGYLIFRRLTSYRQWLFDNISSTTYPTYTWLRNAMLVSGGVLLLLTLNIFLDVGLSFTGSYFLHWQLFYIYLAGVVYYLGITGYQQPPFEVAYEAADVSPSPKQTTTGLSPEQIRTITTQLELALENDRVFLDPDLSLTSLANRLNLSPGMVSAVINTTFDKSFRSFINDRRVKEVKHRLADPSNRHLSILGIALESGFNSEASFYRVFKSVTGVSPRQYSTQKSLENQIKNSQKPI